MIKEEHLNTLRELITPLDLPELRAHYIRLNKTNWEYRADLFLSLPKHKRQPLLLEFSAYSQDPFYDALELVIPDLED